MVAVETRSTRITSCEKDDDRAEPRFCHVDNTVSELSILSVPDSALSLPEKERVRLDLKSVRSLESRLKSNIIGQDHALSHVVSVARRMALGFQDENRPPAVMLFVGSHWRR
jgi:ATP-dependent Clp protease ATP-binding subunit ClpA